MRSFGILSVCLISLSISAGIGSTKLRPNYITDEEFQFAKNNPLKPLVNETLHLPPFGQETIKRQPRPGVGPRLWTNAEVPYTLDPTFNDEQRIQVALALAAYHEATCIRFIPKTEQHGSWVDILHDPTTCGVAHVCMNTGAQFAKFGGSCVSAGTMVHELGHTLCLGHEQTRRDRDNWISWNTAICEPHGLDGPDFDRGLHKLYDYVSIEHYEGECYSGCIIPREAGVTKCGSGGPLSVLDIELLNEMYGCNSGCQGYRYVNKNNGPGNLVQAGTEFDGTPLYSCRAYQDGDIIPGKYNVERGECHVAYGGFEHSKMNNVEVLTNPNGANLQWVDSQTLPENAVRGGRTKERETMYIIQCYLGNTEGQFAWIPGKFQPGLGAYTSYGGQEISCAGGSVKFLVCS